MLDWSSGSPVSRVSMPSTALKNLNKVYDIWVRANCWPMQMRGPPLKGMYSHLEHGGVSQTPSAPAHAPTAERTRRGDSTPTVPAGTHQRQLRKCLCACAGYTSTISAKSPWR